MRKLWFGLIAILVVFGGSAAVVVAASEGDSDPSAPPSATVANVAVSDASGAEFLAPFRKPQDAADRSIPDPEIVRQTSNGGNPELARFAQRTAEGERVWLVPANGGVCLTSDQHVARGCAPAEEIAQGADVTAVVCSPYLDASQIEVSGVMPDGVDGVSINHADGTAAKVDVINNVFVYRTSRSGPLPTTLLYNDAGGTHEVTTSVPPDAADEKCVGKILR